MAEELYTFRYPVEGLQVYRANLKDSESENLLQDLDSYLDFIHTAEQKGGHVLVHCIAGASRSASLVIAYLVKYAGMSLKEAYEHVSECRENVYPNRNFWRCLIEFEERVRNDNTVEIRPYLTGDEPDIHYDYIKSRSLNGWFKELMMFFGMGLMILLIQLYDFTKDI
ncbi:hypothetical protein FSP39_002103 [Pinctada imbricata]|uniref:Uncharacterized protein n=1 Tax=Pinctada imbricata TaxID=66713 RepID=A0AA88Y1Z6_PINIB|nr:hypothetical protein FSP39_002103 [Pinctada imbricata]